MTTDSLTLKHTSARQQIYTNITKAPPATSWPQSLASVTQERLRVQSENNPGNWKHDHGFLASATHMSACNHRPWPGFSAFAANVCTCACVRVFAREETTRSQVTTAQHASVKSHTRASQKKQHTIRTQATGSVTTGSLLLQHTYACMFVK